MECCQLRHNLSGKYLAKLVPSDTIIDRLAQVVKMQIGTTLNTTTVFSNYGCSENFLSYWLGVHDKLE